MKNIFIILFPLLIILGCASSKIKTTIDEFEGHKIDRMYFNTLSGGIIFLDDAYIGLNAQRFQSKEGIVLYSVIVRYADDRQLFINDGESLILLIDGETLKLSGDGSMAHRNVGSAGVVIEYAWYHITKEDIRKIANATEVRVKINGSNTFLERHFSKANFNNFKKFADNYINFFNHFTLAFLLNETN